MPDLIRFLFLSVKILSRRKQLLKEGFQPPPNFFLVSNDTTKGFNYENLSHCENTPFMHIQMRKKISNGPMGRGLRDVTRRQFIKNSTGKLFFMPSGLNIKKQGE